MSDFKVPQEIVYFAIFAAFFLSLCDYKTVETVPFCL